MLKNRLAPTAIALPAGWFLALADPRGPHRPNSASNICEHGRSVPSVSALSPLRTNASPHLTTVLPSYSPLGHPLQITGDLLLGHPFQILLGRSTSLCRGFPCAHWRYTGDRHLAPHCTCISPLAPAGRPRNHVAGGQMQGIIGRLIPILVRTPVADVAY